MSISTEDLKKFKKSGIQASKAGERLKNAAIKCGMSIEKLNQALIKLKH